MRIAAFAVASLLAGCDATLIKSMDRGLHPFVGKDIHAAIAVLGEPTKQQTIAGDEVYTWLRTVDDETCTLHFVTDAANRVLRYDWNGVRKVCNLYDDLVSP